MSTTVPPTSQHPTAPTAEEAEARAAGARGSWLSARIYDPFFRRAEAAGMADRRRRLLAAAQGEVLEIGAGTGLNLPHYPDGLDRLVLTEPDGHMAEHLRRRLDGLGRRAELVRAPGEALPFAAGSFDTVVSTFALCTVEDPAASLAEVRRVLRPGGRLLFLEHVRSDDPRRARWQDRLRGPWAAFADGCRCNQETLGILAGQGFTLEHVEAAQWVRMPRVIRPVVFGRARPGAQPSAG